MLGNKGPGATHRPLQPPHSGHRLRQNPIDRLDIVVEHLTGVADVSPNAGQHLVHHSLNGARQPVQPFLALAHLPHNVPPEEVLQLLGDRQQAGQAVDARADAEGLHEGAVLGGQFQADGMAAEGEELRQVRLAAGNLSLQLRGEKLQLAGVVDQPLQVVEDGLQI